jgi:hypothetical protein
MAQRIFGFLLFFGMAFGSAQAQQSNLKNVFIEIDHGALHCPFLGLKFKEFFSNDTVQNLVIDRINSTAKFDAIESRWTQESFLRFAIVQKVGYPAEEIKTISISNP